MPPPEMRCPFLKQECIRGKCALWGSIDITEPGPLVGSGKFKRAFGCTFNLQAMLMASPRPVIVANPPPGPRPPS